MATTTRPHAQAHNIYMSRCKMTATTRPCAQAHNIYTRCTMAATPRPCAQMHDIYTLRRSVIYLTPGGVSFPMSSPFFYLPMPARKFLISWHITIFAVHGFGGDLVFLCSYPTVGRVNFLFFTFTQKVFVHVTKYIFICFYFKARHLLTHIFHYPSPLFGVFPNTSLVAADVSPHVTVRRSEIYFLPSDVH